MAPFMLDVFGLKTAKSWGARFLQTNGGVTASVKPAHAGIGYRADVDGLRAVAVLSVVAFHAAPQSLPGGFIGVDVFFVISGYLISSLIFDAMDRGAFTVLDFYIRRVKRIFPSLLLVLAASFLVGWFVMLPEDFARLGLSIAGSAAFIQNLVLWAETGYFDQSAELKPLLHIWSLGVEEQFYLVWPFLLLALPRRAAWRFAGIALVAAVSFALNVYVSTKGAGDAFYLPQTRFWELAIGAAAALAGPQAIRMTKARLPSFRDALSILGLLLLAGGFVVISKNVVFPGLWALAPVSGAAALILAGPDAWANRIILSRRPFVAIGLISYPLYLWHWPLLSFGRIIHGGPLRPDTLAPLVLAAFIFAWLSYRFVEKPIRFGKRRGAAKALVLAITMALMGAAGYYVHAAGGLPDRFPPLIAAIIKKPDLGYRFRDADRTCRPFPGATHMGFCEESQRPLIFVMGDSHADMLRFGLDHLQGAYMFGVDAATGCANAPYFLKGPYGNEDTCDPSSLRQAFILDTLDKIARIKPEIVLLHARWGYELYVTRMEDAVEKLGQMVARIREASPDSRIVILGQVPEWRTRPATEIYKAWLMGRDKTAVRARLKSGFRTDLRQWDDFFAAQVPKLGVSYISAFKLFCDGDGCLARIGESASDVTASDSNHLSPAGSIYLLEKIMPELFALFPEHPAARPR